MSRKVNWDEGLALFAEAWKRTGISPEIWCGENGYSWKSAKRYITIKAAKNLLEEDDASSKKQTAKKAANSQKKTANQTANSQIAKQVKKVPEVDGREPTSEPENLTGRNNDFGFEPADYGISEQQGVFVVEYLKTKDKYAAYKAAGYRCEGDSWQRAARRLYRNVPVYRAIRDGLAAYRRRYRADLDELVDQLVAIINADPNDVAQYRRVNCRYCWGESHKYQWCDLDEQLRAERKAEADNKPPPDLSGGIGFVSNDDPNTECPRCHGEGIGETFFPDSRDHEGNARVLFAGVKETKVGIEILTEDKRAARAQLIQLMNMQQAKGASGNRPAANNYSPDDYRAAASSLDDEFGDLD